jgi:nucleotide-binding universal stress UspA family protein
MSFSRILLCVDGAPHTEVACALALDLARMHIAAIDALYVVDPYLKKFTDEIYAVNRAECRAHLDRCLAAEGELALDQFIDRAASIGIVAGRLLQYGQPALASCGMTKAGSYDLVILGGKRFSSRFERWTSRDLPGRLDGKLAVPVLLARV